MNQAIEGSYDPASTLPWVALLPCLHCDPVRPPGRGHPARIPAVAVVAAFSFVATYVICMVLKAVLPGGIRATEEQELSGLDLTLHSEVGYSFTDR